MKALPKRKGNHPQEARQSDVIRASMKAPPTGKGNSFAPPAPSVPARGLASIKVSEKEGKLRIRPPDDTHTLPPQ